MNFLLHTSCTLSLRCIAPHRKKILGPTQNMQARFKVETKQTARARSLVCLDNKSETTVLI